MENETKQIYREKSLAHISSPEQMNSYVRVVSAGVWVALAAIIVLLAGAILWCTVITFETETVPSVAAVSSGELCLYVTEEARNKVTEGRTLHIDDNDIILPAAEITEVQLDSATEAPVMALLGVTGTDCVCCLRFPCDLADGVYEATIVTEEIRPFELLLN